MSNSPQHHERRRQRVARLRRGPPGNPMAALPEYFTDEYHQTVERLTQRHRRAWIGRGSPGKNTRDAAPLKGAAFMARQSQFPRGAQFYPKSPVGFYRVYGAPYDEVIVKALAVLAEQDSAP